MEKEKNEKTKKKEKENETKSKVKISKIYRTDLESVLSMLILVEELVDNL